MTPLRKIARASLSALAGGLFSSAVLLAQSAGLSGRVVDPEGKPVAEQTVVLHRVSESGGAEVARTATDADGRFQIRYDPATEGGIYFAATRYQGSIYMGPTFRAPEQAGPDYAIVVGAGAVGGEAGVQGPPAEDRTGFWVVGLLFGAVAAGAVALPLLRARREPYATRGLLLELAKLEEEGAAGEGPASTDAKRARRDEIRSLLCAGAATPVADAAGQH